MHGKKPNLLSAFRVCPEARLVFVDPLAGIRDPILQSRLLMPLADDRSPLSARKLRRNEIILNIGSF